MRDIIKTTISLLVICFVTALLLAFVNSTTADKIVQRAKSDAEEKRRQVMTEAKSFEEIKDWQNRDESGLIREAYAAYDGQEIIGYVFSVVPKGYGGDINVTVGVKADKTISGVQIGDNKETPGLGSKANDESFKGQYIGKGIGKEIKVVKRAPSADDEIEAISGATISSRAVTNAVQASATLGSKLLEDGGNAK
jgi:electron transport complex protein RnfG